MDLNKLLETGNRCIHSEPPVCNASCPVHLDVIEFMKEIEKGDFQNAYKHMEKRLPFTKLIGKICDHPCEDICIRNDFGGSIRISELEKIVIDLGYTPPKKIPPLPKNKGKVAVIGGGLSGMTVATDLNKKGYEVSIYEKTKRLGGRIWSYEASHLSKAEIIMELNEIEKQGIKLKLNTLIATADLEVMKKEFNAIYIGSGEWEVSLQIDPKTFQVDNTCVFAGGRLACKSESVIEAISSGRRAAISIDRYITGVSLTASRQREGVFETPLVFETYDVIAKESTLISTVGLTEKEVISKAVNEAKRCLKCQCNECMKVCTHMKQFNMSPDAYIRQINQNERIILGTHYANKMINSCTECGLCKEQCHLDISMKDVIMETRHSMVQKKKMPLSAHDFALKDMEFSNSERFSLVRKQPSKEQSKHLFYYPVLSYSKYAKGLYKGSGKTGYVFYPGCQLSASHSDRIVDIYKYLVGTFKEAYVEGDVGLYLGCCGAPAEWAGRQELIEENIQKLRSVWTELEQPTFILACSSCSSIFEKYLPEIPMISLWEIFDTYGLPERNIVPGRRVLNIHDACTSRHNPKIHESIRNIVNQLGYEIKELVYTKDKTKCCGYGGLVYYANKEHAQEFVKDRMNESSEDLLVYCAMCKDLFVEGGKRTFHILDLIYGKDIDRLALKKMPTLSERHHNRTQLKINLLKEIWGEEQSVELINKNGYNIIIPDAIIDTMEQRYILVEDVEKVIINAKSNDDYFYNPETLNYLARLRIDNVTYWVMYEEKDDDIIITNAYCHRMEVLEEA